MADDALMIVARGADKEDKAGIAARMAEAVTIGKAVGFLKSHWLLLPSIAKGHASVASSLSGWREPSGKI